MEEIGADIKQTAEALTWEEGKILQIDSATWESPSKSHRGATSAVLGSVKPVRSPETMPMHAKLSARTRK